MLAKLIGQECASATGLMRLVVPSSLRWEFRHDVASAARELGAEAIVVGPDRKGGEVSQGQAIAYRTVESGTLRPVLLVAAEGELAELKSLETFRDVLAGELPGGALSDDDTAILDMGAVCRRAALELSHALAVVSRDPLEAALVTASRYLAEAYGDYGNGIVPWVGAFWAHLDATFDGLEDAAAEVCDGRPGGEALAVHLAAGLPRPAKAPGYAGQNGPRKYSKIVKEQFDSIEDIERAIAKIEVLDDMRGPGHPLRELGWQTFPATLEEEGHPLSSVSRHGWSASPSSWKNAWSNTSERAFFSLLDPAEYPFEVELERADGAFEALERAGWKKIDFVLPPAECLPGDGDRFSLGVVRVVIGIESNVGGARPGSADVQVAVHPKTAATARVRRARATERGLEVEVELERQVRPDKPWREDPFSLEVSPSASCPAFGGRGSTAVGFLVPHPGVPTILALEVPSGRGPSSATHARPPVPTTPTAPADRNDQPLVRTLSLKAGSGPVSLVVLGRAGADFLFNGEPVKSGATPPGATGGDGFLVPNPGEEAEVSCGDTTVILSREIPSEGALSPVIAAVTGKSLLLPGAEQASDLLGDPRGVLEDWLAERFVRGNADPAERGAMGACLLSVDPARSRGEPTWCGVTGVHSDLENPPGMRFPVPPAGVLEGFWRCFDALGLDRGMDDAKQASWPSSIDLRDLDREVVDGYLGAYHAILESGTQGEVANWRAYPFSAILFDPSSGTSLGALLSPLHPLRLAWSWSAQVAGAKLQESEQYARVSGALLRFVHGGELPVLGPGASEDDAWHSVSLANGPGDYFAAWSLLWDTNSGPGVGRRVRLLGRTLPLGAPSGLDRGSIAAALTDYRRIYPMASQLRVGLSATQSRDRFDETDRALVEAISTLFRGKPGELPGGVRVIDGKKRDGERQRPTDSLADVIEGSGNAGAPLAFEWAEQPAGDDAVVDVKFVEDSPVKIRLRGLDDGVGTAGPALPFARFKAWSGPETGSQRSSFIACPTSNSFARLPGFHRALARFEALSLDRRVACIQASLNVHGDAFKAGCARWIVTGNRNLDPSTLSVQLQGNQAPMLLWEWRPSFLPRGGDDAGLSSTHPYTVIASSYELDRTLTTRLRELGLPGEDALASQVLGVLGTRGIGLSSLLAIGGTHAMGAIGFWLAFRALQGWEDAGAGNEVRCILPLDPFYPLLETLWPSAKRTDLRRRADLVLMSATLSDMDTAELALRPVEVKARSGSAGQFPSRGNLDLEDAIEQLTATKQLVNGIAEAHEEEGRDQPIVNAAIATLLETALAIQPHQDGRSSEIEASLLELAAAGRIDIQAPDGIITWFQAGAKGMGGADHEARAGNPGLLFASIEAAAREDRVDEIRRAALSLLENGESSGKQSKLDRRDAVEGGDTNAMVTGVTANGPLDTGPGVEEHAVPPTDFPGTGSVEPPLDDAPDEATGGKVGTTSTDPVPAVAPPPPGIEVLVGHEHVGTMSTPVILRPSETALNQLNVGVVGDLGTGKTQFLQSLTYQLASSAASNRGHAPRVFIFDYKMDYTKPEFVEAIDAQILDPYEKPLPLNFFALPEGASPSDRVRRANFFRDLLVRICNIGQVQGHNIYECIMSAYRDCAEGHFPTMSDIRRRYSELTGGKGDSVLSVLALLVDLGIFEEDGTRTMTFPALFQRSTVLNLGKLGGAGQEVTDIVATIFLDFLYNDYMKRLDKHPFETASDGKQRRRIDSFVLIDEAHHAMSRGFDVLMKMMLEGREFGLGVILSSQFLSHFRLGGKDWSEPLSTWMIHRVNNATHADFKKIGFVSAAREMAETVQGLGVHWAYFRCANGYSDGLLVKGQPFFSLDRGYTGPG